jgi:hypothetical protein
MRKIARALLLGASLTAFSPALAHADGPSAIPGLAPWSGRFGGAFSANDLLAGTAGSVPGGPALADPTAAFTGFSSGSPAGALTGAFGPGDLLGGMSSAQVSDPTLLDPATGLGGASVAPAGNVDFMSLLGDVMQISTMEDAIQTTSLSPLGMSIGMPVTSAIGGGAELVASPGFGAQVTNLLGTLNPGATAPAVDAQGNPVASAPGTAVDAFGNPVASAPGTAVDAFGNPVASAPGNTVDDQGNSVPDDQGNAATDDQGNLDELQGTTDFLQGMFDDGYFGEDGLADFAAGS